MPIIIEDGSGDLLATANSYVSVQELVDFAEARGVIINDDEAEKDLIIASDYLSILEIRYSGSRSYVGQILPFPRQNLIVNRDAIALDAIPWQLKKAQLLLAMEVAKGVDIMPTVSAGSRAKIKKRTKIDVLETEYFDPGVPTGFVFFPQVDALLSVLYGSFTSALLIRRG